jgi:hypothetical protein
MHTQPFAAHPLETPSNHPENFRPIQLALVMHSYIKYASFGILLSIVKLYLLQSANLSRQRQTKAVGA